MDALAGYGSDSASDDDAQPPSGGGGALSGLLAHYSDESDDGHENDNGGTSKKGACADEKLPAAAPVVPAGTVQGDGKVNGGGDEQPGPGLASTVMGNRKVNGGGGGGDEAGTGDGQPATKSRRRWDNPQDENWDQAVDVDSVLPPPPLLSTNGDAEGGTYPFRSMILFKKDYTADLRRKLSQQLQQQQKSLGNEQSAGKQQLNQKLQQLHDKFHAKKEGSDDNPSAPSFAAHLKSQHDFGNPHLLKSIIDHFDISPLESHSGNKFKRFEDIERLVSAEERARIAKANYDAGSGGGNVGGAPGLPGP